MIHFLEFKLNDQRNITVNVAHIMNIFEDNKGNATIVQSEGESFSVDHTYKEVIKMLPYYNDVRLTTLPPTPKQLQREE